MINKTSPTRNSIVAKGAARAAFTLIELLVVIGIIGVLSAVMIGMMRGSSDSARAAQCMTNMRGLAVAAINFAMQDTYGHFPAAGSHKWMCATSPITYPEHKGWISWNYPHPNNRSKAGGSAIAFDEANRETLLYAITNGCLWAMGGKAEQSYVCPEHDAAFLKANKRHPGWSYVMNESFGWASSGLGKPLKYWTGVSLNDMSVYDTGLKYSKKRSPDRVLMFAEMQGYTDTKHGLTALTSASGDRGDSVLQYKSTVEAIGFNHPQSSGKIAGHVAFADGHVEKLLYPESGNVEQLTQWLCSGRQVSFNGTMYRDITESK